MKRTALVITAIVGSFVASTQSQAQNPHFFQPVYTITFAQETSVFNRNYVDESYSKGQRDYNAIDRRLSDQSRKIKNRKRIDISNSRKGFFFKLQ